MSFQLTHEVLTKICERNLFKILPNGMVFFGLRGCRPVDSENHTFAKGHELSIVDINYENPRCTLGQWLPAEGKLAVFPGSTIPVKKHVAEARAAGGAGANQLISGFYTYVKGSHLASKPARGHRAFRQEEERVILRNSDDMDFDFRDRLELDNPADNLHAAWGGTLEGSYSSAGCQVVLGFPATLDGSRSESGPWKTFRLNAYQLPQTGFRYVLVNGFEAEAMATNIDLARPVTIRFGSEGELVRRVQEKLRERSLITFGPDAECGPKTALALVKFQIAEFGADNTDGIVGPNTATALGITDWPDTKGGTGGGGVTLPAAVIPKVVKLAAAPAGGTGPAAGYKIPKFAEAAVGLASGVPWSKAERITGMNGYNGLVKNSCHKFTDTAAPAVYYEAKFAIDGDGGGGNDEDDPAFQNDTSLNTVDKKPLNSRKYPFIVIPLPPKAAGTERLQNHGVGLGDLGVCIFKNGEVVPVLYGDYGPREKIGEGSMAAARQLGINADPNVGGIDASEIPPGIVHIVFPGTSDVDPSAAVLFPGTTFVAKGRTKRTADDVERDAKALFDKFRGIA